MATSSLTRFSTTLTDVTGAASSREADRRYDGPVVGDAGEEVGEIELRFEAV
jgi:hypothetical protein